MATTLSPVQQKMLAEITAGTYRTTARKTRTEEVLIRLGLAVFVPASRENHFVPSVVLASNAPASTTPASTFVRPTGAALAAARMAAARN